MRFDVQGEDVEFHSGVRSLDQPHTVSTVPVVLGPAWGEKKDWRLSGPQEPTAGTCRVKGNISEMALRTDTSTLTVRCQSCAEMKWPIKTIFSKSINIY